MSSTMIRNFRSFARVVILFALIIFPAYHLNAGTTGKMMGTITDTSGVALRGANVHLYQNDEPTYYGASTDLDGNYIILNIPPGIYDVEISHVTHDTVKIKDVTVNVILTTKLDLMLTPNRDSMFIDIIPFPIITPPNTPPTEE